MKSNLDTTKINTGLLACFCNPGVMSNPAQPIDGGDATLLRGCLPIAHPRRHLDSHRGDGAGGEERAPSH